ncbi:MAG: hypothetical protein WBF93_11145 [Pirellulales bacterium]
MNCQELADRIQQRQPDASCDEVARLCLLLIHATDDVDRLADDKYLKELIGDANIRFQMATDQHAAMTSELKELAQSDPTAFHAEQVWVLIRAIKVQSQIIEMYMNEPALDV